MPDVGRMTGSDGIIVLAGAIDEQDGRVVLRGTARSWSERSEAERIARTVPVVSVVDNHIAIGSEAPPGE